MKNIKSILTKNKNKVYPLTPQGRMQMEFDKKKDKEASISGVVNIAVILGMVGLGFLSKEFLTMIVISRVFSKAASMVIS